MSGPWEKYSTASTPPVEGPWSKYQPPQQDMRGEGLQGSRLGAMVAGSAQGVSMGGAEELKSAVRSIPALFDDRSFGDEYNRQLDHWRGVNDQMRDENPLSFYGGEIAGALAIPGASYKAAATPGINALRMGTVGALEGGAYGFGAGEGGMASRARSAGVGAAVGGAVGAGAPYVLRGIQKALDKRSVGKAIDTAAGAAPSNDALRAEYNAFSDASKARGVTIKESAYAPLVQDVADMAHDFGADPAITSGALAAVDRLAKKSGNVEWRDLEVARKVAANAARSAKPRSPDATLSAQIRNKIDDYVFNLVDGDLTSGSAQGLGDDLAQARKLWSRIKNDERIGRAIEVGTNAKSGAENGIRLEFRKLMNDERFFKSLSKDQQEAIRHTYKGTTVGNILRTVGRFAFSGDQRLNNFLGGAGATGAGAVGFKLGGPMGAGAAIMGQQALSSAADTAAERATVGLATRAQSLARAGGVPLLPPPTQTQGFSNALRYFPTPFAAGAANLWNQ